MDSHAPQAAEAVFLYALECGVVQQMRKHLCDAEVVSFWDEMAVASSHYAGRAEEFLRKKHDLLPVRMQKVIAAYDAIEAQTENDDRVVALMGQKTVEALKQAGLTRYRLCKDLSLNEGNVYAWLAGDPSKVSRAVARKAWRYAESLI